MLCPYTVLNDCVNKWAYNGYLSYVYDEHWPAVEPYVAAVQFNSEVSVHFALQNWLFMSPIQVRGMHGPTKESIHACTSLRTSSILVTHILPLGRVRQPTKDGRTFFLIFITTYGVFLYTLMQRSIKKAKDIHQAVVLRLS